jgi:hypothetical protein
MALPGAGLMLLDVAATSGVGCARCGFTITAESIAQALPPGADGEPDVEWVVATLPVLMEHVRPEGKASLCGDCASVSASAATDQTLLVDIYSKYF